MANFYPATALTGGADGALDAISHTDPKSDGSTALITGDVCIVVSDSYAYSYRYNSTANNPESSPDIIAPESGGGRWFLVGNTHEVRTDNPHSVTAAQAGAALSGHNHDSDYLSTSHEATYNHTQYTTEPEARRYARRQG